MEKYIFVDVDGVLNAEKGIEGVFDTFGMAKGFTFRLKLNKNHGVWLTELAEDTDSKLVWGTTWMEYANEQIGKQIGLPELPVAHVPSRFRETTEAWKARSVVDFADGNPFVWFDDMVGISYHLHDLRPDKQWLLVRVDPIAGLTKKHIEIAREWLNDI